MKNHIDSLQITFHAEKINIKFKDLYYIFSTVIKHDYEARKLMEGMDKLKYF